MDETVTRAESISKSLTRAEVEVVLGYHESRLFREFVFSEATMSVTKFDADLATKQVNEAYARHSES
jgi:hypothetical protein